MDKSIFTNKNSIPNNSDLIIALGNLHELWQAIALYVYSKYPKATEEWKFSGEKYGWNFRIKDKKRAIIYLLPRDKYFKAAFVFGQKAFEVILKSDVSNEIKKELEMAKVYAEGRGIRIDVKADAILSDIKKLIDLKIGN
jgi:hypothetical protein